MTVTCKNEMPPELSVIILCYRAGRQVEPFVDDVMACLARDMDNWEIILVGNYMPCAVDPTPQVVCEMAARDSRIKAIARKKEGMMGWDVRSGFGAATGKIIALIDGDGQMPGNDIMRAYRVMQKKTAIWSKPTGWCAMTGDTVASYPGFTMLFFASCLAACLFATLTPNRNSFPERPMKNFS